MSLRLDYLDGSTLRAWGFNVSTFSRQENFLGVAFRSVWCHEEARPNNGCWSVQRGVLHTVAQCDVFGMVCHADPGDTLAGLRNSAPSRGGLRPRA